MSVRQLMIAIASVGLILGSGLWVARVWPIVIERRQAASIEGFWAANWLRISGLSERSLVIVKRLPITPVWKESLERDGYDTSRPFYYWYGVFDTSAYEGHLDVALRNSHEQYRGELTAICRERAEYHKRMQRVFLRGAWLPWTRLEDFPPRPPVEGDDAD
jgi:hypothetical protein